MKIEIIDFKDDTTITEIFDYSSIINSYDIIKKSNYKFFNFRFYITPIFKVDFAMYSKYDMINLNSYLMVVMSYFKIANKISKKFKIHCEHQGFTEFINDINFTTFISPSYGDNYKFFEFESKCDWVNSIENINHTHMNLIYKVK